MSISDSVPWNWLERWDARLFLLGAVMLVGAGSLKVLDATLGVEFPLVLLNLAGQGGFVVSLLGVLALYPGLADQSPKLSRGGAVLAAIGAVSFAVAIAALLLVSGLNAVAGTNLPTEVIGILFVPGYLGAVLGYVSVGIASTRTGVPSRTIGVLFLAFVAVPVAQMLGFALFEVSLPQFAGLGVPDIWLPVVLLAVGYLLRSEAPSTGHTEPSNDATAR